MNYRINSDKSAVVALEVEYQPMHTCPHGPKVIGLSKYGIARVDTVSAKTTDLIGWAPLPRVPDWMKGAA